MQQTHPEAGLKTSDFYKTESLPERFNHPGLATIYFEMLKEGRAGGGGSTHLHRYVQICSSTHNAHTHSHTHTCTDIHQLVLISLFHRLVCWLWHTTTKFIFQDNSYVIRVSTNCKLPINY